ncbi:hypothetical protein [Chitinophaga arvensicola]|uniref:ZU5 domain-containing protein n=1 Tax=Chitinophaga arvensicola TaxID=29529 RepID=A0A1I0RA06_9BACT|nr:hypothetical protein [Chitinophaga arvensicola]SEW37062.1 hypothetical protein SAMN04488122_2466 [Chitinophaga arvensicola]
MKRIRLTPFPKLLLCGLLIGSLAACKKNKDKPVEVNRPITVFEKGAPVGNAITKLIGPAGGILATPDGRISVTIPPAAIIDAIQFSLQPVMSTLPLNGDTLCYQLQPATVKFAKPVTIRFKYSATDEDGSHPELLNIAYQDEAGHWFGKPATELDSLHKTLTVMSTHFSTWGVYRSFALTTDKNSLLDGEYANIGIRSVDTDKDIPETDGAGLISPLIDIHDYKSTKNITGWTLHGAGTLTPSADKVAARLAAPARITKNSVSTAEVTLSNLFDKTDPTRPGKTGKMILLKNIKLIAGKFDLFVNGRHVDLDDVSIEGGNNMMFIKGNNGDGEWQFTIGGSGKGNYTYGDLNSAGKVYAYYTRTDDDLRYLSTNFRCREDGVLEKVVSAGAVNITRWGNAGELAEGTFEATLRRPDAKLQFPCRVLEEWNMRAVFSLRRAR